MTTAELIEKLERAEGPSRELFEAAWLAIHHEGYGPESERNTCQLCERFDRLLDAEAWESAALMLVPFHKDEDGNQTTQMKWSINPGFRASFKIGGVKYDNLQKTDQDYDGEWFFVARVYGYEGRHKDPAIALVIAALKAKEADNG